MVKKPSYLLWSLSYTNAVLLVAVTNAWRCRAAFPSLCQLSWELPSSCTLAPSTSAKLCTAALKQALHLPVLTWQLSFSPHGTASSRGLQVWLSWHSCPCCCFVCSALLCNALTLWFNVPQEDLPLKWSSKWSVASVPLEYKSKMPNVTLYWFLIFFFYEVLGLLFKQI